MALLVVFLCNFLSGTPLKPANKFSAHIHFTPLQMSEHVRKLANKHTSKYKWNYTIRCNLSEHNWEKWRKTSKVKDKVNLQENCKTDEVGVMQKNMIKQHYPGTFAWVMAIKSSKWWLLVSSVSHSPISLKQLTEHESTDHFLQGQKSVFSELPTALPTLQEHYLLRARSPAVAGINLCNYLWPSQWTLSSGLLPVPVGPASPASQGPVHVWVRRPAFLHVCVCMCVCVMQLSRP